jgi:hypothetical protein
MRYRIVLLILIALFKPALAQVPDGWRVLGDRSLEVVEGSALDFSALVTAGPAGAKGEVQAGADGHLHFAGDARPQRFLCASQPYGVEAGFPDHATADRYARQLRIHGYNLARFTFVDNVLMNGMVKDFDFNPVQLDRFHYFLSALKREGIFWVLDGLTSWNAAYGDVGRNRWVQRRNVKLGVYFDPDQQAHWKELVKRLLGAVNPYTGMRILDDPAMMGVILVNEGGLNALINQAPSPEMDGLFAKYLAARHGSVAAAKRRWGPLDAMSSKVTLPRGVWVKSEKMVDTQRFYYDQQLKELAWMTAYIRGLGYKGLVTAFDNWPTLQDQAARSNLSWVDMHTYHDNPSAHASPGSRIMQTSSLEDALGYVRNAATARYWGKPFTISEYDQPFWNRWRYESGLAMGAYAGFQGWDLLCRHASGPIELAYGMDDSSRRQAIYPYGIGMDPIARAGETLAALLYLRGDVQPAKKHIGLRLSPEYVFDQQGGIGHLPDDITRLGLITGIGLVWQDTKLKQPLDAVVDPQGVSPTLVNKFMQKVRLGDESQLSAVLADLRKRGVLAGNSSDGKNYFESDTKEISLDTDARVMKVITPRTEAVAFAAAPGKLNALSVQKASAPALVSASSLDGAVLEKSRRILLIVASDARNSGMQFTDKNEEELVRLGGMPILLRNIRVQLALRHENPDTLSLYALRLNGERGEKIPIAVVDGASVAFALDTGSLAAGPTTYFELVEK